MGRFPGATLPARPVQGDVTRGFVSPWVVLFLAPLYPFARLLAPEGAHDPWLLWWLVAAPFVAISIAAIRSDRVAAHMRGLLALFSSFVTVQLFVSAHLNQMQPFYAVGSAMAVMGMALLLPKRSWLAAYFIAVAMLCVLLYRLEPDARKIIYWGGALPLVVFAYYRLDAQVKRSRLEGEYREMLETRVAERTGDLLKANQRLQTEILQREQLEQEMRVVQKMEALGRLTGGIAHDFNNLITTITVYSELLRAELPKDSRQLEDVAQIESSAAEAASLVRSLLSLARNGSVQSAVLDLNEVVRGMADLIRHLIGQHSELDLRLWKDDCRVSANLDQLHQVLINLVLNARDAMPTGGRLAIEVAPLDRRLRPAAELPELAPDREFVTLVLSDDGAGMDAQTRDRAFEPFFSTKDPSRGSGLGLSSVYGIVKQCGGHIRVDSELGVGSRFEIFLPTTTEPLSPRVVTPRRRSADGGSERILLVEDESDLREALRRVLAFSGYEVTEARDGREALTLIGASPEQFDLVVSDVVMPRMSGIELVEELLASDSDAKVLLLSGYLGHPSVEQRTFPADTPFLAKPFTPADLTAKIREVLDD